MTISLQAALDNTEITYKELVNIANDLLRELFAPANSLIQDLDEVNNLSNDAIRDYMIKLAICSYSLGETKEKASLKAECAEALRKEKYARQYNAAEGTNGVKENTALIQSSDEIVAEALYNLMANLTRTKLDEIHRVVDVLKSVLMSRNAEAKLTTNVID